MRNIPIAKMMVIALLLTACAAELQIPAITTPLTGCAAAPDPKSAPFFKGSGTPADPYQICTVRHFNAVGVDPTYAASYYVLESDLDFSTLTDPFVPWGNATTPFVGTLNGQGHTIANLTYNDPTMNYVGLIGYATGATVKALRMTNGSVTGFTRAALLIGHGSALTLDDIQVQGTVVGTGAGVAKDIAGIVGEILDAGVNTSITNVESNTTVNGDDVVSGGLGFIVLTAGANFVLSNLTVNATTFQDTASLHSSNTFGGAIAYLSANASTATVRNVFHTGNTSTMGSFSGNGIGTVTANNGGTVILDNIHSTGDFLTAGNPLNTPANHGHLSGGLIGTFAITSGNVTLTRGAYIGNVTNTTAFGVNDNGFGGILGNATVSGGGKLTVSDCFSQTDVHVPNASAIAGVGPAMGNISISAPAAVTDVQLTNLYASGGIFSTAVPAKSGGFVGSLSYSIAAPSVPITVTSSYYNSTLNASPGVATAGTTKPYPATVVGATTAQLKTQSTFVGWDFTNVWSIASSAFPILP